MIRTHNNKYEYVFPVFKFLSQQHAEALLNQGSGRLTALADFCHPAKYAGAVRDANEGSVTIRNHYTHYSGLAKNADGLIVLGMPPFSNLKLFDIRKELEMSVPGATAYCVTQHFFSKAVLLWAKERNKEACVLIKEFDTFLSLIDPQVPQPNRFIGFQACAYRGRVVEEVNPGPNCVTNFLLSNPDYVAFVKPKDYEDQMEVRAVWSILADALDHVDFKHADIPTLCMKLDYSHVRRALIAGADPEQLEFGARIHHHSTDNITFHRLRKAF